MPKLLKSLDIHDHNYGKMTSATAAVGNWTITTSQDIDANRNYYSKAWHRKYGAKFTVSNRQITFTRPHGRGTLTKTMKLKSWSGDYVARAVIEFGLEPKRPKFPLSIRLNKAYDATFLREKHGFKFYARTLLGEVVDYVIVSPLGTTYHDDIENNLTKGLRKKIKNRARKLRGELIDWTVCKKLGFCDSGLKEFCNLYGLNTRSIYTPEEIERVIRKRPKLATPFLSELKTLARAVNYQFTM